MKYQKNTVPVENTVPGYRYLEKNMPILGFLRVPVEYGTSRVQHRHLEKTMPIQGLLYQSHALASVPDPIRRRRNVFGLCSFYKKNRIWTCVRNTDPDPATQMDLDPDHKP